MDTGSGNLQSELEQLSPSREDLAAVGRPGRLSVAPMRMVRVEFLSSVCLVRISGVPTVHSMNERF